MDSIQQRLRDWRDTKGYSQQHVANLVEAQIGNRVPRTTVANYEVATDPPVWFLTGLYDALPGEVDVGYLVTGVQSEGSNRPLAEGSLPEVPSDMAREIETVFDEIVNRAFSYPEIFLRRRELQPAQLLTYRMSMYADLRQITRALSEEAQQDR